MVNTTINVSADKRRRKYKLLEVIKDIVYKSGFRFRVTSCMEMMNSRQVDIIQGEGGAFYRGVMACGSVWLCPVCASRITEGRRQELQQALSENTDLIPVMITATLQHEKGDRLFSLMDVLNASLRKMKAGRWWKARHLKNANKSLVKRPVPTILNATNIQLPPLKWKLLQVSLLYK